MKLNKALYEQQIAQLREWEENTELALKLWGERIRPEQVVRGLASWVRIPGSLEDCGTTGCFGGWLSTWPEFLEKGLVERTRPGMPIVADGYLTGYSVAYMLFGDAKLFHPRGTEPDEDRSLTEYDTVIRRLEARLYFLQQQLNWLDAS
jgi:hypothetical protein